MNTRTSAGVPRRASSSALSRRLLLGGAAGGLAVLAAGCSGGSIPIITREDPDDEVRRGVAASEQALIAAYDTVLTAFPSLAGRLRDLRTQHQAHLAAVSEDLELPSPSASAPAAARGDPPAALRALRRLEAAAARQRIDACTDAEGPELAELLARIGASESGHVAALTGGTP